jgi:predicted  nucleic acid-binding Zn-ribbon protein
MFIKPNQITLKEQMDMLERENKDFVAENRAQLEEISDIVPISIEKAPEPVRIDLGEMNRPLGLSEMDRSIKSEKVKKEIMQDAAEIMQQAPEIKVAAPNEKPVENITIVEKGRYFLDINSLMMGNPLVIRSELGVFYIRIPSPIKGKNKVKNK